MARRAAEHRQGEHGETSLVLGVVETLWARSKPTWGGLAQALENVDRLPSGVSPDLAGYLAELIEGLTASGEPFPASAQELHRLLNRRAAVMSS